MDASPLGHGTFLAELDRGGPTRRCRCSCTGTRRWWRGDGELDGGPQDAQRALGGHLALQALEEKWPRFGARRGSRAYCRPGGPRTGSGRSRSPGRRADVRASVKDRVRSAQSGEYGHAGTVLGDRANHSGPADRPAVGEQGIGSAGHATGEMSPAAGRCR